MNEKELRQLKQYSIMLSKGIDPTSKLLFTEDTILNSPIIRSYHERVARLINELLNNTSFSIEPAKFSIWEDIDRRKIISDNLVSISEFTYKLNENRMEFSNKLQAKQITKWLLANGYLEMSISESQMPYKIPTLDGQKLGIVCITKENEYGNSYPVNLYNSDAQEFILDNIESIVLLR